MTQFGFCYAMRLIGFTQAGHAPSASLADNPGPLPKFAGMATPPTLQPQSTNGLFMQSQPSAQVPQNTTTYQSQPQDPIPPISPSDYQKFSDLFIRTTGSPTNELTGTSARDIFLKAKLPTEVLGQIWSLVDTENLGKLGMSGFVVAMHLIQGLLSGTIKQLPPFLSEAIWQSAQPRVSGSRQSSYASVTSQQTVKHIPQTPPLYAGAATGNPAAAISTDEWTVSSAMAQQYESIFNSLDKSKTGKLNPDQVASFLMTSKLGQQDLATVWDLADIQNTGVFSKLEFSIALFLVNKKLAGSTLPNVVPDQLIKSLSTPTPNAPAQQTPAAPVAPAQQPQPPKPLTAQKTSMDELADVFGSPSGTPSQELPPAPAGRSIQPRASSSDLTPSNELPKVRKNLSGFQPTSSFGQSLMHSAPKEDEASLLGDDVHGSSPRKEQVASPVPPPVAPAAAPAPLSQGSQKAINYDALRSVPPPPKKAVTSSAGHTPPVHSPQELERNFSSPSIQSPASTGQAYSPAPPVNKNNDLLADPVISGQLSQATSDIANISNQVKSLNTQTTDLHEKKRKAQQELDKILSIKKDIESKLRLLRTSYDNEVKQHQEVEASLSKAKEESEALRSESSIAEAKFNHLSGELNEKQVAIDQLQRENGTIREKLGNVNAEITELGKQFEAISIENQKLNNQLSVKKSQVQVVLVQKQTLEAQIRDTIAANQKLQDDINRQAEEEQKAIDEQHRLEQELAKAKLFEPVKPEIKPPKESGVASTVAGTVMGAAAGVGLGAVAQSVLGDKETEDSTPTESSNQLEQGEKDISAPNSDAEEATPEPKETSEKPEEPAQESVKETLPEPVQETLPGAFTSEPQELSKDAEVPVSQPTVEALVDEVKEKPAADLTGMDDIEKVESKSVAGPKLEERTNTTSSTISTDGETAITSPASSDYQFPQGGMVGMPGVLVGVQRTESLTSSVQNNAALSVRDDNIDEFSDRETIGVEESDSKEVRQESDGDKPSSGVESFEIVNADDANEPEDTTQPKGSQTFVFKNTGSGDVDEEFPPIKELDYDESESSEDEDFHEAKDLSREEVKKDDFDSAFDDLEPAADDLEPATAEAQPSAPVDEFDEFEGLEAAKDEETNPELFDDNTEDFFNNDFTNSNMPDFGQVSNAEPITSSKTGNDEWEQLFAGFGNSASNQNTPQPVSNSTFPAPSNGVSDGDNELIQELVGMGFDEKTAYDALEKEGWDLQAATNYLLDSA